MRGLAQKGESLSGGAALREFRHAFWRQPTVFGNFMTPNPALECVCLKNMELEAAMAKEVFDLSHGL